MSKRNREWFVYFDVPRDEQDEVLKLGAKYNRYIDKYYYQGELSKIILFAKWILGDKSESFIVGNIYILESKRTCWKCQKETTIIGLGIDEYIDLYRDENTKHITMTTSLNDICPKIHLTWVNTEQDIPPALLRYLKMHYPVSTDYSSVAGKCFANHCEHCGSIQGNNYIFSEVDSPLILDTSDRIEILNKLSNIKIKSVCCDVNLCVEWNILISPNDDCYANMCHQEKTYIWNYGLDCLYEEMYNIPIINPDVSTEPTPEIKYVQETVPTPASIPISKPETILQKISKMFN